VWTSGFALALLAATPLAAQDNATAAPPPAPAPAENIGPQELSNFSLNGTVTRRAEPAQQPATEQPRAAEVRTSAPPSAGERPAPTRQAASETRSTQAQPSTVVDPIPGRRRLPQSADAAAAAATAAQDVGSPLPAAPPAAAPSGFSPLPWLAALLLLGAGAAIYFGRQRQRGRYAVSGGVSEYLGQTPQPQPAPVPPAPRQAAPPAPAPVARPQPAPPAPNPAGVVTSRLRAAPVLPGVVTASLRPWIELELEPSQAMVTDEHAAIAFDVTLYNSGSAPARDVAIQACLINAGQQQDVELSEFYTSPGDVRDKIPAVPPMGRITLKSAVRLPRSAVQEYEVEGRKLFMPMVAVNSRYRWSSGEGQSAASFLVGPAANDSQKLAPLRLDQGKRGWKSLAARRYEKGIRR